MIGILLAHIMNRLVKTIIPMDTIIVTRPSQVMARPVQ